MNLYTILFLVIAVFLIFRLYAVFGRRTGNERPPTERRARPESAPETNGNKVIPLPTRNPPRPVDNPPRAEPAADVQPVDMPVSGNSALDQALRQLMNADRNFTPAHFLVGAKLAYEMIVGAFANGDRKTLRPLLSKEVFDDFDRAIVEREQAGQTVESSFVGLDSSDITEAALRGTNAQISVRFVAKMIQATRDKAGEITSGDPSKVIDITDIWTFSRDIATRDPNWRLIATESA